MTGDWASSQAGLDAASAQITEEFKSIRAETGAGGMLNDNLHNYMANSYELLVTDVFNALNYYNQGDLDNAHATLRMLEERQQQYEGLYGNILEEEPPSEDDAKSVNDALDKTGISMKDIMGKAPKKPADADKYTDSAFAYYVGMVIRTMKGNTDNQFDAKKLAALNSAFASAYNDETNIPAGQGRVDVLSLAGKIAHMQDGSTVFPIPVGGLASLIPGVDVSALDPVAMAYVYSFPEYQAEDGGVTVSSVKIGGTEVGMNELESFDKAVQKNVALNAHRAYVRSIYRSTIKKTAAIVSAGAALQQAADKAAKLPGPVGAKAVEAAVKGANKSLLAVDASEKPDTRQCSYLPKAAYAGGVNMAPGEYDVVIEYSNGTKDTKHVTVAAGKTTLVESVCLK